MTKQSMCRRAFIGRAATWCAAGAGLSWPAPGTAQAMMQIREMRGDVLINGRNAALDSLVRPGDTVMTGSDGWITFVLGQDAYFLRARTEIRLERGIAEGVITALRLVTGALGATFRRGTPRTITAPNVTAGIRGTGVYLETRPSGTYACACFGAVQLVSSANSRDRAIVEATRHHAHLVLNEPKNDSRLEVARQENHSDEEMDGLERLVGRRAPWVR